MANKKKKILRTSKKFGKPLGSYEDKGKTVIIYEDGNQIYFVKDGKIMPDMTIHTDDIEELLTFLAGIVDDAEEKEVK